MRDFLKWTMFGATFAVPFVLLFVSESMFFPYITGKNFAFRILVEIGFAAWIILMLVDQSYRPRLSYILYAILGLVGVMFVANLLGEYAPKSFWSNYERMEGWVTLVHFFMYFIVLGSILKTEKLWNYFFNTALVAAVLMSLYSLGQVAGVIEISQGGSWRVDARLGNSTYLGVYMLFHIFIALWMLLRAKSRAGQWIYGILAVMFAYILTQTGTRGAMYGLIGGGILTFLYLALMAPRGAVIKKVALGGLVAVVLLVSGVYAARDTEFVQNSEMLNRFAGTTLSEGNIRFMVWRMAFEGVKEHSVLGWGQENFNYVFNKYYDPGLYDAESWYDRTHNIFLDWLIAGGVLGLLAYLSVLLAGVWYAALVPAYQRLWQGTENAGIFSVYEQALLLGLLAAYMFHNLFVFDNLASWIFYAVILALIHSRVSREWTWIESVRINKETWYKVAVPSVTLLGLLAVYFVNFPSMLAARDIIDAYRAPTPQTQIEQMQTALERGSLGNQEVFEQMSQMVARALTQADLTDEQKATLVEAVDAEIVKMKAEKPGDARVHVIAGSFYRAAGQLDKAMMEFQRAQSLSPTKQAIIEEQGLIYLIAERQEEAVERYRAAYELDTANQEALVRLAAAHLYFVNREQFDELLPLSEIDKGTSLWRDVVEEPMLLQVAAQKKEYELLEYILEGRIELEPNNTGPRVNLAALYMEQGDAERAKQVIQQAIADIPAFAEEGERLLSGIEAENQ